eukprot:TRINITY_DN3986_c0_g1_i1.p1 TRINITY_DN3986_c0_g1~~TRINITY_DN3986_c0_g1_i1.p1  ORF type:complete len:196 (+),score=18.27 TRINITY_DN3986_c0_g1_i1:178-765(+)
MERQQGLIQVLSLVLQKLVSKNDKAENERGTVFHAKKTPSITIKSYLERIFKYSPCSVECFIIALIYIDRLIQNNQQFCLTSLNVHRILLTSVMLASKYFDDAFYNNSYYARVGGITPNEINMLELEFLFLINFSLNVTPETFNSYHSLLEKHMSSNGLKLDIGTSTFSEVAKSCPASVAKEFAPSSFIVECGAK